MVPAILVTSGDATPVMIAPKTTLALPPGMGTFTCCARNHTVVDAKGVERTIPCDKENVGRVMSRMLLARSGFHLEAGNVALFRVWKSFTANALQGLPEQKMVPRHNSTDEFLSAYKYDGPHGDEVDLGAGFTPLMMASVAGNVEVVRELVQKRRVNINARCLMAVNVLGIDSGQDALCLATGACPRSVVHRVIEVLISAGADPNAGCGKFSGLTPLMNAVTMRNFEGLRALVTDAGQAVNLEQGLKSNNATALTLAALMSTTDIVEELIEAGANSAHVDLGGGNVLTAVSEVAQCEGG